MDPQNGLSFLVLRNEKAKSGKFPVMICGCYPGETASAASLALIAERQMVRRAFKILLLPRGSYQITQIAKPEVKQDELHQSLRWALTPLIDYPIAQANIDWLAIPSEASPSGKAPQLHVISTNKAEIDSQAAIYASANLALDVADIRETSQRNIATQLESGDRGVCLIYAESTGIQITVSFRGELFLERFIRETLFGNNDSPDDAQLDRVALEVQRSIDFIRRVYPAVRIEEVLVAPTMQSINLAERLGHLMQETVHAVDLGDIFEWPAGSDLHRSEKQALYFHALGASLRFSSPEK